MECCSDKLARDCLGVQAARARRQPCGYTESSVTSAPPSISSASYLACGKRCFSGLGGCLSVIRTPLESATQYLMHSLAHNGGHFGRRWGEATPNSAVECPQTQLMRQHPIASHHYESICTELKLVWSHQRRYFSNMRAPQRLLKWYSLVLPAII
jgi:hypothetical protein